MTGVAQFAPPVPRHRCHVFSPRQLLPPEPLVQLLESVFPRLAHVRARNSPLLQDPRRHLGCESQTKVDNIWRPNVAHERASRRDPTRRFAANPPPPCGSVSQLPPGARSREASSCLGKTPRPDPGTFHHRSSKLFTPGETSAASNSIDVVGILVPVHSFREHGGDSAAHPRSSTS